MKLLLLIHACILLIACKDGANSTADGLVKSDLGVLDGSTADLEMLEAFVDSLPVQDARGERLVDGSAHIDGSLAPTVWAVSAGGSGSSQAKLSHLAIDSLGNTYIVGSFQGSATFGSTTLAATGVQDLFVAKLDSKGKFLWAASAKGSSTSKVDVAGDVALDGSGNVYITGVYSKTATFGSFALTSSSSQADLFVAKLDSSGSFQWAVSSTSAAGSAAGGVRIALDGSWKIYVAAEVAGTVNLGSIKVVSVATNGAMTLLQLSPQGTFVWAAYQSGSGSQRVHGLAVDSTGNSLVTGENAGSSIFGSTTLVGSGASDVYVTKVDPSGSFQWATGAGGAGYDYGSSVHVDLAGGVHVTGVFNGPVTFGKTTLSSGVNSHLFLAELDSVGAFKWATTTADSGNHCANDLALDSSADSFLTGYYQSALAVGSTTLINSGTADLFVVGADPQGKYLWGVSTKPSGSGYTSIDPQGITIDASGDLIVGGTFSGSVYFGGKLLAAPASYSIFVWKLKPGSSSGGG
jgi:hypothetical protein